LKEVGGAGRPWRRVAGFAFILIAFSFLGYYVASNVGALRAQPWEVRPGLLLLSLAVHIAGLAWGVAVWQILLRLMGYRVSLGGLMRVWFVSGLGRYIPGKIWQFVGAAHLGNALGIPAGVTVTALAVHAGFFLLAAGLTSIYLLPAASPVVGGVLTSLRWGAPLLLFLLHPAVIGGALRLFRRLSGRASEVWTASWRNSFGLLLLACIGWALTGVALYLFLLSLTPLPGSALPAVVAINALSFVLGYAVFVAPAGLGAREVSLAALLALFVPAPVAALLAVAARLWTVAAEVIPALFLMARGRPDDPIGSASRDSLPLKP